MNQPLRQQVKKENDSSSQQMDDLFDSLIQSGEISADFKKPPSLPGKEKLPSMASCGSPLSSGSPPSAELAQAAPPPSGSV